MRRGLLVLTWLLMQGCAAMTARQMITTLDERRIPACVQLDLVLTGDLLRVHGDGMLVVYTAAGGADFLACLRVWR